MLIEKFNKGWTIAAIAEETGFDPKTVRKYVNGQTLPVSKERTSKGSKLDPYKEYLLARLDEGTTNCEVLLDEITKMGYNGKMTILRDFIRPYRVAPKKQMTVRYETPPGRQAQVDWAEVGKIFIDGKERSVYLFNIILGYSRVRYIEFTYSMDTETLMRCHLNAFNYFNGVPQTILYDNMKTVVIKHSITSIEFNRRFSDFLAFYGVTPKACKPYRPQTKGKVERSIFYVQMNFLQRKLNYETLQELNAEALNWINTIANVKPNGTTKESPFVRLEVEQGYLMNTHKKESYPIEQWEMRKVQRDGILSYKGTPYQLPISYGGKEVMIRLTETSSIEVYFENKYIDVFKIKAQSTAELISINKNRLDVPSPSKMEYTQPEPLKVEQRSLKVYEQLEGGVFR